METTSATYKVLLIEDDASIHSMLRSYLKGTDFRLIEATSAEEGLNLAIERRPDLILLDLGLPDADGVDVVATLREWTKTPIIIMSGRTEDESKVRALDSGADDYVTKPFSIVELMARLRVAIRHLDLRDTDTPVFEAGPLKIDYAARRVWIDDAPVTLTPLEYKLICTLAKHSGKVVTHRQLLSEVWGPEYTEDPQYLRVYVGYLRRKLEPTPESQRILLTEHRVGYRLAL